MTNCRLVKRYVNQKTFDQLLLDVHGACPTMLNGKAVPSKLKKLMLRQGVRKNININFVLDF